MTNQRYRILRDWTDGTIVSLVCFFVSLFIYISISYYISIYMQFFKIDFRQFWSIELENLFFYLKINSPFSKYFWPDLLSRYPDFCWKVQVITWISGVLACASATFVFIKMTRGRAIEEIIKGRWLSESAKEATQELKTEPGVPGIFVHPEVQIGTDRETRHMLVVGSVGAGKTQMLWPIVKQIRANNEKCIIHDVKGDFAACIESEQEDGSDDFLRLALWDDRSAYWDIARDCETKMEAREVAACFILASSDPMWSNAAQIVLVTFLVSLQKTKGQGWGWRDLANCLTMSQKDLFETAKKYNPEAVSILKEEASKTTDCIMITVASYMSTIFDLSDMWENGQGRDRISIKEFLDDKYNGYKTLILQNNQAYSKLLTAVYPALLRLMSGHMNGPFFSDSKKRKLWFILDEFPQLGKLEGFGPILETGRSKGLRCIIGVQDIAQLTYIYQKDQTESWTSLIGTWLIGRIAGKETTQMMSGIMGEQIVKKLQISQSVENDVLEKGDSASNLSYKEEKRAVMEPSEFSSELNVSKKGITALLMLHGCKNGVYKLLWGFTDVKEQRPVVIKDGVKYSAIDDVVEIKKTGKNEIKKEVKKIEKKRVVVDFEKLVAKMQVNYQLSLSQNDQGPGGDADHQPPARSKKRKKIGQQEETINIVEEIGGEIAQNIVKNEVSFLPDFAFDLIGAASTASEIIKDIEEGAEM